MTAIETAPVTKSKISREQFIGTFVEATRKVFSTMVGWEVCLTNNHSSRGFTAKYDISAIIGFSGKIRGTMVVSVDQEVALTAAGEFLGAKPTEVSADVIDMVGELTNMIGGSSKDRLGIAGAELGLPAVIYGRGHQVTFQPSAHVEVLQFTTPFGPFSIEIGIPTPIGN